MKFHSTHHLLWILLPFLLFGFSPKKDTTSPKDFAVIAYYAGNGQDLDNYKWEQVTHVIYSFCHLRGQKLAVDNAKDSVAIRNLVALKQQHKNLKVLLSLGGWGGCKTCSAVFAEEKGRKVFARSVKDLMKTYNADGIDLDWEYPGIAGYPDHPYMPEDKQNFTDLVKELRKKLRKKATLSFAAGGFDRYLEQSIEWGKVMPMMDYVNLMSYDLVSGYSTVTGHHTPLYSTEKQEASTDRGVQSLLKLGVPAKKIVIGAAFYARSWSGVADINQGLYQSGKFKSFIPHHRLVETITAEQGFTIYRDTVAKAAYAYSPTLQEFATFDDPISVALKTEYAIKNGLGGIMFWQMTDDRKDGKMLQSIWDASTLYFQENKK